MKKIFYYFVVLESCAIIILFILSIGACREPKVVHSSITYEEHQQNLPQREEPKQVLPPQVILGPQVTDLPGEDESYEPLAGFQAGFIMPIARINEFLNFRAELNGSSQGANYEEDYGLSGKVSLFYLNLPLVLRYQFRNGFFGEAGIQPGICISAKDKYSGSSYNYKDQISTFDFGIPLGIGYEFRNGFGLGLRVIEGINNVNSSGETKDRNFVMALRGSYSLKGIKK